jgi:hypothetical protein
MFEDAERLKTSTHWMSGGRVVYLLCVAAVAGVSAYAINLPQIDRQLVPLILAWCFATMAALHAAFVSRRTPVDRWLTGIFLGSSFMNAYVALVRLDVIDWSLF